MKRLVRRQNRPDSNKGYMTEYQPLDPKEPFRKILCLYLLRGLLYNNITRINPKRLHESFAFFIFHLAEAGMRELGFNRLVQNKEWTALSASLHDCLLDGIIERDAGEYRFGRHAGEKLNHQIEDFHTPLPDDRNATMCALIAAKCYRGKSIFEDCVIETSIYLEPRRY